MKELNHFIQEKLSINKNTKLTYNEEDINELSKKLDKTFKGYGEFEHIIDNNQFYFCILEKDELDHFKNIIPKDIFDKAKIEKSNQGAGEIFYNFDLSDVVDYYSSIEESYDNICKWFNYLL